MASKAKKSPTPKKKPVPSEIISRQYMGSPSEEEWGAIDKQIDQLEHDIRVAMRDDPWIDPKTSDRITVGGVVDGDDSESGSKKKKKKG